MARALRGLLLCLAATCAALPVQAEVHTFDSPTAQGRQLDFCDANGQVCGSEIADRWCINEGYDSATDWSITAAAGSDVAPDRRNGARRDFESITCTRDERTYTLPNIRAYQRSTVFSPNGRSVQTSLDFVEYRVLMPGCNQRKPGVFLCESVHDFQHCRTLYHEGRVFGCRAGVAFASGFAKPMAAPPDTYTLDVDSKATAVVEEGQRGEGKLRGGADYVVRFQAPALASAETCLERDRYVYNATGPNGGMESIDDTAPCGEPIKGSFEPHEDDLFRAYDECAAAGAWGSQIERSFDVLVAGLFHIASGAIVEKSGAEATVIEAPYVVVQAPLTVSCRP